MGKQLIEHTALADAARYLIRMSEKIEARK